MSELNTLSSPDIHLITLDNKQFILIGTAHISRESVELVRSTIIKESPDCVCLELDDHRFQSLVHKTKWESLNLLEVIKKKQLATLIVNLMLSTYQKKLGVNTGVAPGSEMLEAYNQAKAQNIPVGLCDRDARITLKRAWRKSTLFKKSLLLTNIFGSFFDNTKISEEELKNLRQKDYLSEIMEELGRSFPDIKAVLIDERDIFLAEKIKSQRGKKILAVLGAGHIEGIKKQLAQDNSSQMESISQIPPVSFLSKVLGWSIPATILISLGAVAWFKGIDVASENALYWILATGTFCALGALASFAHPLTILAGFLSAPITALSPLIGAGHVTAFVQVLVKPPQVQELQNVSVDFTKPLNWWKNKFLRVLLCFILPGFGSMLGTWMGGLKILSNFSEIF